MKIKIFTIGNYLAKHPRTKLAEHLLIRKSIEGWKDTDTIIVSIGRIFAARPNSNWQRLSSFCRSKQYVIGGRSPLNSEANVFAYRIAQAFLDINQNGKFVTIEWSESVFSSIIATLEITNVNQNYF